MASTDNRYQYDFTIVGTILGAGIGILTPIFYTLYTETFLPYQIIGLIVAGIALCMTGFGWLADYFTCYVEEQKFITTLSDKSLEVVKEAFYDKEIEDYLKKLMSDPSLANTFEARRNSNHNFEVENRSRIMKLEKQIIHLNTMCGEKTLLKEFTYENENNNRPHESAR